MSSSEFPRVIEPTEVRKGDTVEITEQTGQGELAWRFVVADVTDKYGTGPAIVPPRALGQQGGWHCSVFTMDNPLTLTLIERAPGPAWEAKPLSLWRSPEYSDFKYIRAWTNDVMFIDLRTGKKYRGDSQDEKDVQLIDAMIPDDTPRSRAVDEGERLREDVIEAISAYVAIPEAGWEKASQMWEPVKAAVRALRDYEAAEVRDV